MTPHPAGAARSNPLTAWVMVGGGALMLGGVLIIGLLIYQDRRHRIADDGTQTSLGSLLSEAPTVEQPRLTES